MSYDNTRCVKVLGAHSLRICDDHAAWVLRAMNFLELGDIHSTFELSACHEKLAYFAGFVKAGGLQ